MSTHRSTRTDENRRKREEHRTRVTARLNDSKRLAGEENAPRTGASLDALEQAIEDQQQAWEAEEAEAERE